MGKKNKKVTKKNLKLQRLMARLTLLNEQRPTSQFQVKIWNQQRDTIIRQLKKYGIEVE